VSDPPERTAAALQAAHELAHLIAQGDEARALLAGLRRDMAATQSQLDENQARQLLQANEQLVLAMMQTQAEADSAVQALKAVSRSAELDGLTQLPNRVLLLDRLAHAITSAGRRKARFALLFVDLDNFKHINDTLGHAGGDEVLKLTAKCLTASVRAVDTVSRHGGDEFLVLLAEITQPSDAERVADKVIAALGTPRRLGEQVLCISASIGISVYPNDGEDAETLIDCADAAMYRSKRGAASTLARPPPPPVPDDLAQAEHHHHHAQMREANEHLVLAALSAQELQAAAEQAQRKQTELLALVAHELRNPLAPLRGAAALLGRLQSGERLLLPRIQAIIERQVAHMSRLVGDLVDLSRVHTGKLRLDPCRVDLISIVDAALDACRPAMELRLQNFDVQLPADAVEIDADPVRLAQVLSNLLGNASKYTPEGGDIALAVQVVGDSLVMTVTDNGIGITAAALPLVFEPFVQDPHATNFNGDGLGIGLTVVRELVEAHGGTVSAASAGTGLGSRFVVTLPLRWRAEPA
jgi:diguanylate cyclase (GGDEF)-like protein